MIPRVIAHRGASAVCPENTFAAFDEAVRQGCDAIELDVQLTSDGTPVVFHDKTLRRLGLARLGLGRRRVTEVSAGDLHQLDAGLWFDEAFRGEPIPELKEVVRRYADRVELLIELKFWSWWSGHRRRRLVGSVVEQLQRDRRTRRCWLLSFSPRVLAESHRRAPDLRRVLNVDPPRRITRSLERQLLNVDAVSANVRTLSPDFAADVRVRRRPLFAWTCNTDREVACAVECAADGVMADRPDWLRERLDAEGVS